MTVRISEDSYLVMKYGKRYNEAMWTSILFRKKRSFVITKSLVDP